jgi:sugar/nucleoside kinase (ribokinase family)
VTRSLLVIGQVVTDVVARHAAPLRADTDTPAEIAIRPGGAAANAAAWAARCGADVTLLARVGRDRVDWHRAALLADGVRPWLRTDLEVPTAVVLCLVDAGAERTLVTDPGAAARLGPDDWDDRLLAEAAHVHLSGYLFFSEPGRGLAAHVIAAANARGIAVSVDPASTGFIERLGIPAFHDAIAGTDLLLPNEAEARLLTGGAETERAAAELSAGYGRAVVTLGARGALVAEGGGVIARIPAPSVRPVDTTGAGDAFTGGYLAALLRGADPVTAAEAGCRTAAQAVTAVGARPPRSYRTENSPMPSGTGRSVPPDG